MVNATTEIYDYCVGFGKISADQLYARSGHNKPFEGAFAQCMSDFKIDEYITHVCPSPEWYPLVVLIAVFVVGMGIGAAIYFGLTHWRKDDSD